MSMLWRKTLDSHNNLLHSTLQGAAVHRNTIFQRIPTRLDVELRAEPGTSRPALAQGQRVVNCPEPRRPAGVHSSSSPDGRFHRLWRHRSRYPLATTRSPARPVQIPRSRATSSSSTRKGKGKPGRLDHYRGTGRRLTRDTGVARDRTSGPDWM